MLHSFYTEIEKILQHIASDCDRRTPQGEHWHRELLRQMSTPAVTRPPVISPDLAALLNGFLMFRHLFRNASIVRMRWEKLAPLIAEVPQTYEKTYEEIEKFIRVIQPGGNQSG